MDKDCIIPYIEPIFHFCCNRLNNRHDAEDLASKIICHILEGMKKYKIESFDAWIWRIAHNRYARFIDAQNKNKTILAEDDSILDIAENDYCFIDEASAEQEYQTAFRYLHTLSSEYRNIFVDRYIGEMSIKDLATKYSLPETTVKWRLNIGRQKIRKRIGENNMEKVYKRINWNTTTCNGSIDVSKYLSNQMSRAICHAAYEKPLTIEEISMSTGIPALYIEEDLQRLEYGEAICKIGNKYATNFIIFRLQDRKYTECASASLIKAIADRFGNLLNKNASAVNELDFFGHDFGMDRLGYFVIPYILRQKINMLKNNRLQLQSGPFPPRKDGGYGWFIVEETVDENEKAAEYETGCNIRWNNSTHIYYYWIYKFFYHDIYKCNCWLCENDIPQKSENGIIKKDILSDEDAARLIQNNLIVKSGNDYKFNFAYFTEKQFNEFISLFDINDDKIDDMITEWIMTVRKNFEKFVPMRLNDQINQWVSCYLFQIIGYVVEDLISRGTLQKPDTVKPLINGVVCIDGKYIELQ